MLVSTGATTWGADWKQYPWTTGWQPATSSRARSTARRSPGTARTPRSPCCTRTTTTARTYITGLEEGLGAKTSNIVGKEPFEVTAPSVASQIAKLKATGATVFVIFATPTKTIQAYATAAALKWSPAVVYTNSVSATDTFLTLAKANGAGELVNRTFTTQYAKDPANPKWDNDAGMKLYKQVMAKYYPKGRVTDALNLYGVATAHAFVRAAVQRGHEPDARLDHEGVPDLERGEPVPAPRRQAEDRAQRTSSRSSAS